MMAAESLTLMERISAQLMTSNTKKPLAGKEMRDLLNPDYEGESSAQLPLCIQELVLSDSEDDQPSKPKPDPSSKNNLFNFSQDRPRSTVLISDSSDEEFENFLVQLKTPKPAANKIRDKLGRLKDFIVDSEEEDCFYSMTSRAAKGLRSKNDVKTSVNMSANTYETVKSVPWDDTPVFISDSDEDSIAIKSSWRDRHTTKKNVKSSGLKPKSALKEKENFFEPPKDKCLSSQENMERTVLENKCCTRASSDDEFESLMDRIKKRINNQTPSSMTRKIKPKTPLTEPAKGSCLDLANQKAKQKQKILSYSEPSSSPYFSSEKLMKEPLDALESAFSKNTSLPCKVPGCFLKELSCQTSPYVKNFKQKKHELTTKLYNLYNSTIFDQKLPQNLEILWNKKMRKTAGYCVTGEKKQPTVSRYARIELSEKVCDSADRLRDTLIHETCHAATWLINGVRDGHGQYWQFYARKSSLIHPELPMVTRCHTYEINYRFTYECSRCKTTIGRHSKSLDTEKFVCALCKGKLVLQTATRKDGSPTTPLTPFAKYVKENYGSAKKEMTGLSHAEVMRKLSANFSNTTKISN